MSPAVDAAAALGARGDCSVPPGQRGSRARSATAQIDPEHAAALYNRGRLLAARHDTTAAADSAVAGRLPGLPSPRWRRWLNRG